MHFGSFWQDILLLFIHAYSQELLQKFLEELFKKIDHELFHEFISRFIIKSLCIFFKNFFNILPVFFQTFPNEFINKKILMESSKFNYGLTPVNTTALCSRKSSYTNIFRDSVRFFAKICLRKSCGILYRYSIDSFFNYLSNLSRKAPKTKLPQP